MLLFLTRNFFVSTYNEISIFFFLNHLLEYIIISLIIFLNKIIKKKTDSNIDIAEQLIKENRV